MSAPIVMDSQITLLDMLRAGPLALDVIAERLGSSVKTARGRVEALVGKGLVVLVVRGASGQYSTWGLAHGARWEPQSKHDEVLALLATGDRMTIDQIGLGIGVSHATAWRIVQDMLALGDLRASGFGVAAGGGRKPPTVYVSTRAVPAQWTDEALEIVAGRCLVVMREHPDAHHDTDGLAKAVGRPVTMVHAALARDAGLKRRVADHGGGIWKLTAKGRRA